jgi:hypothetical protein
MRRTLSPLLALLVCAGCPAPKGDDTGLAADTATDGFALAGAWTDEYDTVHEIDETRWTQTYPGYDPYVFDIASWDGAERRVVAQNGADNAYDPGLWSRFDWLDADDGHLYYCQSAFSAATQAEAEATPGADASDLEGGCGGFPWTDLTP